MSRKSRHTIVASVPEAIETLVATKEKLLAEAKAEKSDAYTLHHKAGTTYPEIDNAPIYKEAEADE